MSAPYRSRALAILRERRTAADAAAEKNYRDALDASPILASLAAQGSSLSLAAVKAAFADPSAVAALREKSNAVRSEFDAELRRMGLNRSMFEAERDCTLCNDTGFTSGKPCRCLLALEARLAQGELAAGAPLAISSFGDFDLGLYPSEVREKMRGIFEICTGFAKNFPAVSQGILMFGPTGLGKTHLSLAIAGEVIKKGYAVVYGSAGGLLSRIEREHFSGKGTAALDSVMNCDLLVLDDLGTEFSSAFNASTVYNLINGRILASKPTIISTNLSLEELNARYTDRIVSRIAGGYELLRFEGKDIRIIKKSRG